MLTTHQLKGSDSDIHLGSGSSASHVKKIPTIKILDLGLALLNFGDLGESTMTGSDQLLGTLDYMAPEQANDTHDVDIRADIYGLGATLYKLLTGFSPLTSPSDSRKRSRMEKFRALLNHSVPSIELLRPDLPKGLIKSIDRMLERDRTRRFQQPVDVANALAPFCAKANLMVTTFDVFH